MIAASQMRSGMAILYEGQPYKVIAADYHPGQGKMGGVTHARLLNLSTGTAWEQSFRSELKLDELPLEKRPLDFLYRDGEECNFMDPGNYEQVAISAALVGPQVAFLQPQMRVPVEFLEDRPVAVLMPEMLEVKIADTAPPIHNQQDSAWKSAKLENGVVVMVPQFIKIGDSIRLELESLKYMDRVKTAQKGS